MSHSVLIIDDEPMICIGLLKLVDWHGYGFDRTDIRFNYDDGLNAALLHRYTLIITDICIYDSSGLELVRIVREKGMCENFILISAHAEFEYARMALQYGVRGYLLKPLDRGEVIRSIESFARSLPPPEGPPSPSLGEDTRESGEKAQERGDERAISVGHVLEYIQRHYSDKDISISKIANGLYVNASHLGQCFRKKTGLKFADYLNQFRVVKACELFLENKYRTYEISERIGFSNPAYFHRVFKKVMGCGTDEYRRKVTHGLVEIPSMPKELPEGSVRGDSVIG